MQVRPKIRALTPHDDLGRLTELIHAAYAPHAAGGLRFWGTHQTVEDTAKRFSSGLGLVAEADGDYVGTVTVRPPQLDSPVALYREAWSIAQFAVDPTCKGLGIGRLLHEAATSHAIANGASVMAIDTAAPAAGLIAMYKAWGYEPVGEHRWVHTNYVSVLMQRVLSAGGLHGACPNPSVKGTGLRPAPYVER